MTIRIDTAAMAARRVRYADLIPCTTAFIDTRTPGSDRKENFTIIGPGVAENPDQHVHISEPHGFNIGGARQPPHCVNSQHSHETAEVFAVLSGDWKFTMGVDKADSEINLHPGDIISIPTNCFRGFENVGSDSGFLFAVLGGDDPGRVTWAPDVLRRAASTGLVLLENGALIDTAAGRQVPPGQVAVRPLEPAELERFDRINAAALAGCVVRAGETAATETQNGLPEALVIGRGGVLDWPHGFTVSRVDLSAGAAGAWHAHDQPEVLFVLAGTAQLEWDDGKLDLAPGDTMSVPRTLMRRLSSTDGAGATLLAVRGGDALPWATPV
ncbi:cupin domain-containing protein [Niveispirillum cyanobacteriorum]|uniref:Cupin domain-containing protein n=1 Tax=Niveispirillum cyanobacteriorum TaxID=1612173 RepID=A0A2K9NDE0_9PROT|nr:cupin domain-containing protein [Niveispirillum cyanobacteriorum]AUN31161.1 cupin domain-containing protein [Niveispirillum cyanobacteriorum]GGE88632.1 cupin [Niveispirillum cyanobacteriorum]